ncbi:unnamed protein product, partial [Polarella glacialis]
MTDVFTKTNVSAKTDVPTKTDELNQALGMENIHADELAATSSSTQNDPGSAGPGSDVREKGSVLPSIGDKVPGAFGSSVLGVAETVNPSSLCMESDTFLPEDEHAKLLAAVQHLQSDSVLPQDVATVQQTAPVDQPLGTEDQVLAAFKSSVLGAAATDNPSPVDQAPGTESQVLAAFKSSVLSAAAMDNPSPVDQAPGTEDQVLAAFKSSVLSAAATDNPSPVDQAPRTEDQVPGAFGSSVLGVAETVNPSSLCMESDTFLPEGEHAKLLAAVQHLQSDSVLPQDVATVQQTAPVDQPLGTEDQVLAAFKSSVLGAAAMDNPSPVDQAPGTEDQVLAAFKSSVLGAAATDNPSPVDQAPGTEDQVLAAFKSSVLGAAAMDNPSPVDQAPGTDDQVLAAFKSSVLVAAATGNPSVDQDGLNDPGRVQAEDGEVLPQNESDEVLEDLAKLVVASALRRAGASVSTSQQTLDQAGDWAPLGAPSGGWQC